MISVTRETARWIVTLDRADKANALSAAMLAELAEVFEAAAVDPDLRVLVLTGAGDRVFCAGADLASVGGDAGALTRDPVWTRASAALAALPCLTICALNGTLAGGGFALALACDLRVAVAQAKFFYPVLKNGFLPQADDVSRMVALIGPARTRLVLLAGQKLLTDEALTIGLIDRMVQPADLWATVDGLSEAAMAAKPEALVSIKRMTQRPDDPEVRADAIRAVYEADIAALDRLRLG